jgi:hypothetical protein
MLLVLNGGTVSRRFFGRLFSFFGGLEPRTTLDHLERDQKNARIAGNPRNQALTIKAGFSPWIRRNRFLSGSKRILGRKMGAEKWPNNPFGFQRAGWIVLWMRLVVNFKRTF